MSRVAVSFEPRSTPLAPVAVVACGPVVAALARALVDRESLARLTGVTTNDALIVLGDEAALPWTDGVQYLGRDPDAPELYLPTTHGPDVPPALLARAFVARGDAPPIAIVLEPRAAISIANATPLDRDRLRELAR